MESLENHLCEFLENYILPTMNKNLWDSVLEMDNSYCIVATPNHTTATTTTTTLVSSEEVEFSASSSIIDDVLVCASKDRCDLGRYLDGLPEETKKKLPVHRCNKNSKWFSHSITSQALEAWPLVASFVKQCGGRMCTNAYVEARTFTGGYNCEYPGCNKIAHYGSIQKRNQWCRKHKPTQSIRRGTTLCSRCAQFTFNQGKCTNCDSREYSERERVVIKFLTEQGVVFDHHTRNLVLESKPTSCSLTLCSESSSSFQELEFTKDYDCCKELDIHNISILEDDLSKVLAEAHEDDTDTLFVWTHDKLLPSVNFRPDFFVKIHPNICLIIEVDEYAHGSSSKNKDIYRMREIRNHLGGLVIFLRYNPDRYYQNRSWNDTPTVERLETLWKRISFYTKHAKSLSCDVEDKSKSEQLSKEDMCKQWFKWQSQMITELCSTHSSSFGNHSYSVQKLGVEENLSMIVEYLYYPQRFTLCNSNVSELYLRAT